MLNEQHEVVELLALLPPALLLRVFRTLARRLVKALVLLRRKPRAVAHLPRRTIGIAHIRERRNPALPVRRLQDLAQADHLVVQGLAAGPFPRFGLAYAFPPVSNVAHPLRLVGRSDPVKAIVLDAPGRDLGNRQVAEKGVEVETDHPPLAGDVVGVPLSERHRLELFHERGGGFAEGLLSRLLRLGSLGDDNRRIGRRWQRAPPPQPVLCDAVQIPILRELACVGDVGFLGRLTMIATAQIGRALPVPAVLPSIDVEPAVHERVRLRHMTSLPRTATV